MRKYLALALAVLLVGADQWSKALAYAGLSERITVIPGLFYLTYLENTGAAFGLFQGQALTLGVVSIVVLAGILYLLLSGKVEDRALVWGLSLIFAGGAGNLIDRLSRGFVIDFLDFSALFGFPIFNLADIYVVVGTGLMMIYIIFFDKKKTEATPEIVSEPEPETPPENEAPKPGDDEQTGEVS